MTDILEKTTEGQFDLVGFIIAHESGELEAWDTLRLFSHLIASGQAWSLQGSYGRAAKHLIDSKLIDNKGQILVTEDELEAQLESNG